MSKTLFNQNTFQNKNVTNDGDITELTKATADIAANTAAIAGKQDLLTTGEGINISVLPSTTTIKFDGSALSSDIVSGGDITGIQLKYTDVTGVVKNVEDEINGKQNDLTAGDGIDINGADEISLSGTRTGNFIITGNFESSGTEYKLWNETSGGTGTSNGRALVHTGSGTKETSILRVNYTDDFGGGTQIDGIVGIAKEPDSAYVLDVSGNVNISGVLSLPNVSSVAETFQTLNDEDAYMLGLFDGKQDTLTDADNAGTNISISAEGVISATGTTYTAGDGIDIDGSNQISFDGIMSQTIVTSGNITGATMNYVDNGVVTNIQTEIGRKQDILTDADNAGNNITISATGVIDATDTTYSDTGTGAILVDGTTISLDFSRTDAEIECPQQFRIEHDPTPQFLVSADPNRGSDVGDGASAVITIRGQRMNTTTQRAAQLSFENRDYSLSNTRYLFELAGQVTNDTTNIGGMLISNFADGETRTGNTTMSASGNWYLNGSGAFQDEYGLRVSGTVYFDNTVKSDLRINKDGLPQLLVKPQSTVGQDAEIEIRGARNGSETSDNARLTLSNFDADNGGGTNHIASIHARVTDKDNNIGGMIINNYPDGSTENGAMTMSASGNFLIGGGKTFQDTSKFQVTGTSTASQIKTTATNTITGNGDSNCSLVVADGILLCDGGSGNGTTNANGVLQVNARGSGKLVDCAAFRAQNNGNNIINFCNLNGNVRGRVDGDGSSNVRYRTSSDRRLKENVEDLSSCWEVVKNLSAKRFDWIEDGKNDVGFIAQEVYALDEFVTMKPVKNPTNPDDDKYYCCDEANMTFDESGYCEEPILEDGSIYAHALDYGNFTPYLWKALQEAIIKIETLETKVADLEAQIIV